MAVSQTKQSVDICISGVTDGDVDFSAPSTSAKAAMKAGIWSSLGQSKGTFICNGTNAVTVTDANIQTTSLVMISLNTVGGTVGAIPTVKTITGSTSFTTAGTASDTSTYNYMIINP